MRKVWPGVKRWVRANGAYTAALIGILAASWATWLNLGNVEAAVPSTPALDAPSPGTPSSEGTSPIVLPTFMPDSGAPQDVVRYSMLNTRIEYSGRTDVVKYTVQAGDSVFGIADKFSLKPETILWANYDTLKDDPDSLSQGQVLNILPVDGVYYQWQDGDTIQSVANTFGADPEDILDSPANNLNPFHPDIKAGDWIVVPGGHRAFQQWLVPTIARGQAGVGAPLGPGACSGNYTGAVGTGSFIWPSRNHFLSGNNYWSGHLAIDIAANLGDPIWAADSGVVVFAGWSVVGYGNMVLIDHGNGWQTLYAHMSKVLVHCGESVAKGQTIGQAGATGNATGPHLHFETRYDGGFVDPWFVLP